MVATQEKSGKQHLNMPIVLKNNFTMKDMNFEQVTAYYLEVKYGHDRVYERRLEATESYLTFVEQRLKNKLGRLKFYKLKYVTGHLYTRHDHKQSP